MEGGHDMVALTEVRAAPLYFAVLERAARSPSQVSLLTGRIRIAGV